MTTILDDNAETTKTQAQQVTNEVAIRFAEFAVFAHANPTELGDYSPDCYFDGRDQYEEEHEQLLEWFGGMFRLSGQEPVSMCELIGLVWLCMCEEEISNSSLLFAAQELWNEFEEWDRASKKSKLEPA